MVFCRYREFSVAKKFAQACVTIEILCHDRACGLGRLRCALQSASSARSRATVSTTCATTCSVRATVHVIDLRQCTVMCIVWVTIHGTVHEHCSWALFKKKKRSKITTPGIWGVTLSHHLTHSLQKYLYDERCHKLTNICKH